MDTFVDNFGNEFIAPYIPNKIVGFAGIDPSQKGLEKTEITTLTAEQTALIDQMINNYILRLKIHIDGGNINQNDDEPPPILLTVRPNEIPHEKLDNLLGGDNNGHYHLTEKEMQNLTALINTLIPNDDEDVIIDHENLDNLLGGILNQHFHLSKDDFDKLKILLSTVFPSGSIKPVFPGGSGTGGGGSGTGDGDTGSGDGDTGSDGEDDDFSYAGLPKIAPPAWKSNIFPGARISFNATSNSSASFSAWSGVHKMYYGNIPVKFNGKWPNTFLVVPMTRNGSASSKYLVCTQDLKTWYEWFNKPASRDNQYVADYIFLSTSSKHYLYFLHYPNTLKAIYYKNQSISNGGANSNTISTYGDGKCWIAGCYSNLLNLYIFASQDGYINRFDPTSGTSGAIRKEKIYTGLSSITPSCIACAPIGNTSQIFCVTGPGGTATSVNADSWTAHSNAPHNLRDIAYHEDIGGFLAWCNDDKHFYKSADGENWIRHSANPIPLDDVVTVAYSPDVDWYCAIGGNSKFAYFSQNLQNWIETTVSSAAIPMGSVIWMPSTHNFVLMPSSGATYYTFDPDDWK